MKRYRHYPYDDQLEGHKAREREKQRQALVAIAESKAVQEAIKAKERLLKLIGNGK